MSAWLWAGSSEMIRVRRPRRAIKSAVRAAVVDLPTPPFPRKKKFFAFIATPVRERPPPAGVQSMSKTESSSAHRFIGGVHLLEHQAQFALHEGHQIQRHLHGRRGHAHKGSRHQDPENDLQFFQFALQRLHGLAARHLFPGGAHGRQAFPQALECRTQVHFRLPLLPVHAPRNRRLS